MTKKSISKEDEHSLYRRYSMTIQWSDEDDAYIVTVPEFPGCMTHGSTYEEAARQGQDAIESWVEANMSWGHEVPAPSLFVFPEEVASIEVQAS